MIVRWAVVTGASRGIGWAIADRLSADGYGIVATGRDVNRLDGLAQLISDRGGQVETRVVDFTSAEEVEVFALDLVAGNYQIGALVNNAGFVEVFKYQETPKRLWKDAFQVNLQSQRAPQGILLRQSVQNLRVEVLPTPFPRPARERRVQGANWLPCRESQSQSRLFA